MFFNVFVRSFHPLSSLSLQNAENTHTHTHSHTHSHTHTHTHTLTLTLTLTSHTLTHTHTHTHSRSTNLHSSNSHTPPCPYPAPRNPENPLNPGDSSHVWWRRRLGFCQASGFLFFSREKCVVLRHNLIICPEYGNIA